MVFLNSDPVLAQAAKQVLCEELEQETIDEILEIIDGLDCDDLWDGPDGAD